MNETLRVEVEVEIEKKVLLFPSFFFFLNSFTKWMKQIVH